ncbi:MAG: hypothetical protein M3Q81_04445 [bacterium]|nr:hypothetical protein [bacterium]
MPSFSFAQPQKKKLYSSQPRALPFSSPIGNSLKSLFSPSSQPQSRLQSSPLPSLKQAAGSVLSAGLRGGARSLPVAGVALQGMDVAAKLKKQFSPQRSSPPQQTPQQSPSSAPYQPQGRDQTPAQNPNPPQFNFSSDQQAPQQSAFDSIQNNYVNAQQKIQDERLAALKSGTDQNNALQDQLLEQRRGTLVAQKGDAEQQFADYERNSQADIESLRGSSERQKASTEDLYGKQMRQSALAKRQTDAQRQNVFAALGTLESGGQMGYTGQQFNSDQAFLGQQDQIRGQQRDALISIDDRTAQAERQTTMQINSGRQQFKEAMRQIDQSLAQGGLENQAAKQQAYQEYQKNEFSLRDYMSQIRAGAEQEKLNMRTQLSNPEGVGLSQEFMQTGQVKNMSDFLYRTKNAGAFGKIGESTKNKLLSGDAAKLVGMSESGIKSVGQMISILEKNPNAAVLPGMLNRDFKFAQDNLIDTIGRLRSGGAIGDAEAKNLSRLVPSALDSKELKQQKLSQIESELSNAYMKVTGEQGPQTSSSGIDSSVANYLASQGY